MNRAEIEEWITQWLADQLGMSPQEVETDRSFASYGLDEESMAVMGEEIEDYFEEAPDERFLSPRANVGLLTRALCILCGTDEEDLSDAGSGRDGEMDATLREIGFGSYA